MNSDCEFVEGVETGGRNKTQIELIAVTVLLEFPHF